MLSRSGLWLDELCRPPATKVTAAAYSCWMSGVLAGGGGGQRAPLLCVVIQAAQGELSFPSVSRQELTTCAGAVCHRTR